MTDKDKGGSSSGGKPAQQQTQPQKTDFPKSQDFREGQVIKNGSVIREDKS